LRILRRPFRVWNAFERSRIRRGQFVIVDPDDVPLGVLVPPWFLNGRLLRAQVTIASFGSAVLAERRRIERAERRFELVSGDPGRSVALIAAGSTEGPALWIEHCEDAAPGMRMATLAIAAVLPQLGVGCGVVVQSSG
jgi:hypothetical protein